MCNLHSSLLLLANIFPVSYEPRTDRDMSMNICLFHNLPEKCKAILKVNLSVVFVKERPFWSSTVFPLWKTKTLEAKAKHLLAYVPQNLTLYSGSPDYFFSNRMRKDCNPNHSSGSCEEASRNGSSSNNPANNSSQSSSSQHTRNSTPQLHPSLQVAQFSGTYLQLHLFPGRRVLCCC